jgi:protein-disulfide isomerase
VRWVRAAIFVGVVLIAAGCAKAIDGVAAPPPGNEPTATVMLTADGYGIQLGKPTARTSIEIFTDPQCSYCARLQMFQGGEIADYIDNGRLLVTYRPLASLDASPAGYSHRVSNALFLAAAPESDLPAVAVQSFVQQLYWDSDPSRDDQYIATIAGSARMPQPLIDRIASGKPAVDTVAMDAANRTLLTDVRRANSTPTVYDLNARTVVDTTNNKWLKSLVGDR